MTKRKLFRVVALVMAFAMALAMAGCTKERSDPKIPTRDPSVTYTVKVTNRAGTGLKKCSVEVFSDASMTTQIYKGIADDKGEVTFKAEKSDDYVAVITKLPTGYRTEEQYKLTGERTNVILYPAVMDEVAMDNATFTLGDAMMDFTITLPDYSEVTLSDLLKEKKAVVLNFWFMNCAPCKMEFPYLQEGYEQLSDDIALLALNPVDSTAADIAQFQANNGYTFTMSKCDPRWQNMLKLQYFPTTVIIDRHGNICLIHSGGIESTQDFLDMVEYFTQDNYVQKFFKSAAQVPVVND